MKEDTKAKRMRSVCTTRRCQIELRIRDVMAGDSTVEMKVARLDPSSFPNCRLFASCWKAEKLRSFAASIYRKLGSGMLVFYILPLQWCHEMRM